MFSHAAVVGVRQLTRWDETTTVEEALAALGRNTGNMMFTQALLSVLSNARLVSYSVTDEELDGCDCIVLAAANWLNDFEDFSWLADRLAATDLPVFLVGVGAQSTLNLDIPKLPDGTIRLLQLVAARSKSISTRGEFSKNVLAHYGFSGAISTGCPSLLLAGPAGPAMRRSFDPSSIVLHATRHGYSRADHLNSFLYREAFRLDADLLLQSELSDMYFALGRTNNADIVSRARSVAEIVYGVEESERVEKYLLEHGKVFTNYLDWTEFMKNRSFCFGTRIHGTVASIVSGTPAVLIVHDSRTLEMAQSMHIPFVRASSIDMSGELDVSSFAGLADWGAFLGSYSTYYQSFVEFFCQNGLAISRGFSAPNV